MPDHKQREATMPTPSRSNLAQILLDLRGVEGVGLCSLQQSDIQLCLESYRQENNLSIENDQSSQQDTCNCRKSKCLKLYCQCFAARATCSSSCRCVSCENRPDNATVRDAAVNMILERNPNAFDSKYRPTAPTSIGTTTMSSTFTAISSVAHKNGCRCRKSMCLKKYCECYQGGVPCSSICTCLSCQNTAPSTLLTSAAAAAAAASSSSIAATIGAAAALQTANSDLLLLSNHSKLSDQSMFANPSRLNETKECAGNPLLESSKSFSADKALGSVGGGVSRPPLAPSLKRKRESAAGSAANREETEERGRDIKSVKQEQSHGQDQGLEHSEQGQEQGQAEEEQSFLVPPPLTPAGVNMSMSMSMNLSREQQKQLLNELLFQELQSQGMLTSPLTSYLTNNCPGLMQSEGTTMDDLMNIFRRGSNDNSGSSASSGAGNGSTTTGLSVGTPAAHQAAGGTLLSYTPAIARDEVLNNVRTGIATTAKTETSAVAAGPFSGSTGLTSASPNTFSIATALALLAASGHFQTLAAKQQQHATTGAELGASSGAAGAGNAMGICEEDASALHQQQQQQAQGNNSRSRSSVPTSALALASARRQQQLQMHHDHDPFSSLTKLGSGGSGGAPPDACTPVAAALLLGSGGDTSTSAEAPSSSSFQRGEASSSSRNFGHFSQSSLGGLTDGETTVGSRGSTFTSSSRSSGGADRSSFLSDDSMCSFSSMSGGSAGSGSEGKEASMLLQAKYKHHYYSNKQQQAFSPQEPSSEVLLMGLPAKALFTNDGPLSPDNLVLTTSSIGILENEDRRDCDDRLRLMAKENASPNKAGGGSMRAMVGVEKHNNNSNTYGGRSWR